MLPLPNPYSVDSFGSSLRGARGGQFSRDILLLGKAHMSWRVYLRSSLEFRGPRFYFVFGRFFFPHVGDANRWNVCFRSTSRISRILFWAGLPAFSCWCPCLSRRNSTLAKLVCCSYVISGFIDYLPGFLSCRHDMRHHIRTLWSKVVGPVNLGKC